MKKASIAFQSFMDGFTQAGLFRWAKLPGSAEQICEQTDNIEESQFAELLMPFLKKRAGSSD